MDTALVIISLLSLGLAGALLVYAAKLQQEQRERSEARVAALRSEIALSPAERSVAAFHDEEPWDRLEPVTLVETVTSVPVPGPFTEPDTAVDDRRGRLVATVLIGVVAMGALGAAVYGVSAMGARTAPAPAAAHQSASLELVTLRTERGADSLTVAGTLHNPATSATQHGLVATVFAFDAAGKLLTSAEAPIDYQALASGDDSPFVVKMAGAHTAARVRVSFRQNGNIVPHTDRRER